MALQIGDQIPEITLLQKTEEGVEKVNIAKNSGKNLLLLFIPAAGTGVCTEEMCLVSKDWNAYNDLNAVVYGVSVDSPFAQEVWAKANNITLPLLSDFNKEAINAFDAKYDIWLPGTFDMHGVAKRSAFVFNSNGKLVHSEVLENAGEMPNLNKVKEALQS
ncbi:MAG: redoxin domain-containing protein [Chlorobi bacterium]|nr:redoxin domain-containing protein [Chlorobiota bacterium]